MKNFILLAGLLASAATAHMQLSEPLPIRSPLNKDSKGKKDYSYTNPLQTDGSDYPCKGYADDPFEATANYTQGETYDIKLQGSATHKGGSCQISLSYDKGKSFHVIHSMIGGCPLTKEYQFTVPKDAPSGKALLGWTWFNKVGNREMYMNCAQVNIGGSNKRDLDSMDLGNEEDTNTTMSAVDTQDFKSLPSVFIANVNGPGKCKTIEGKDVNFPKPGPSVEGSVDDKGYRCECDADFLGTSKAANVTTESSHANNDEHDDIDHHAHEATASARKHAQAFGTPPPSWDSKPDGKPHSGTDDEQTPKGHEHHTVFPHPNHHRPHHDEHDHHDSHDALICSHDGKAFSLPTAHGSPAFMGPVADGTVCRDGAIVAA